MVQPPRQRVLAECERRGLDSFVAGCTALLTGPGGDYQLVAVLGGESAVTVLSGGAGGPNGYWPRVWAARGLLHAWSDAATDAIITATDDEAWRVREMAAKVVARHRVGEAMPAMQRLREDPVPRVRAAAERAVVMLTAAGA